MTSYSNPRMRAVIENWPASGTKRVTATFEIEVDPKRGERACRTTTGATKKLTYARKARIVDGDDGRTYIAEISPSFRHVCIMRGDMQYQHETVHPSDGLRYSELLKLFEENRS